MKQENRRMLAVTALYALIPLLLALVPELLAGVEMEAYGWGYSLYMVLMEFGVIVLPAFIWILTRKGREDMGGIWLKKPTAAILIMIPLALSAYFCMNGVSLIWLAVLEAFGLQQVPQNVPIPQNAAQLAVAVAVVAMCPAVCEEFFFRGVLQPVLHKHWKPWIAILVGGCMFGMVHGQLAALPAHVLLGVGICLVAYWTKSIWYTALWHVIQNATAVLLAYLMNLMPVQEDAAAASADILQQPEMLLIMGGMMTIFFGIGMAIWLFVLFMATRRQRAAAALAVEKQPAPKLWAYAPLLAAVGCIVYFYATEIKLWLGGGI